MRTALIITYHFSPRPTIGSVRMVGLAKFLPLYGWKPIILTPKYGDEVDDEYRVVRTDYKDVASVFKKGVGIASDKGLYEQLNEGDEKSGIVRLITKSIVSLGKSIIFYPDAEIGWKNYAIEAGRKLLCKEQIDAIISSSKPETSHIVANRLKGEFDLPWVADFRDLWTQNHYYSYGPIRRLMEKQLEISTLSKADALVTVSSPLATLLSTLNKGKCLRVIKNGFDPLLMEHETPLTEKFTITYTGSLYEGKRDPITLFRALSFLINEGTVDPKRVCVRFYGEHDHYLERLTNDTSLNGIVDHCGIVDREKALFHQRESQILLLLNWNHPTEEGVYTGKLFEYLAAKRPILAVGGPAGVVSELLTETNSGTYVSNLDDCIKVLRQYWTEYCTGGCAVYRGRYNDVSKYSQMEMARSFAKLLDEVVI